MLQELLSLTKLFQIVVDEVYNAHVRPSHFLRLYRYFAFLILVTYSAIAGLTNQGFVIQHNKTSSLEKPMICSRASMNFHECVSVCCVVISFV